MNNGVSKDYKDYKDLGCITFSKEPEELKKHYKLNHTSYYWSEPGIKYFFCEKCKIKWKKDTALD